MPEKIDMATAVALPVTQFKSSAWKDMQNAVMLIPQNAQSTNKAMWFTVKGKRRSKAIEILKVTMRKNKYGARLKNKEKSKLPTKPKAPKIIKLKVTMLSGIPAICFRKGSI